MVENGLYRRYNSRENKKVIDGEQGGISKSINWEGGGDFVYAELKKVSNFDNQIKNLNKK